LTCARARDPPAGVVLPARFGRSSDSLMRGSDANAADPHAATLGAPRLRTVAFQNRDARDEKGSSSAPPSGVNTTARATNRLRSAVLGGRSRLCQGWSELSNTQMCEATAFIELALELIPQSVAVAPASGDELKALGAWAAAKPFKTIAVDAALSAVSELGRRFSGAGARKAIITQWMIETPALLWSSIRSQLMSISAVLSALRSVVAKGGSEAFTLSLFSVSPLSIIVKGATYAADMLSEQNAPFRERSAVEASVVRPAAALMGSVGAMLVSGTHIGVAFGFVLCGPVGWAVGGAMLAVYSLYVLSEVLEYAHHHKLISLPASLEHLLLDSRKVVTVEPLQLS